MNETILEALKKFGLSKNEAVVYLESLKKDELSPFQIAKLTKIPRTTVYDILMTLSLKGLVELEQSDGFKKQQTLVRAKNPSIMRAILQNKRKELIETESDIVNILPMLKEDFHKDKSNADFRFYPGIKGAKKVYFESINFETLDQFDNIYAWDMQLPMDAFGIDAMNMDISENNVKKTQLKIKTKELMPLNDWTKHVMTYQVQRDPTYLNHTEYHAIENPAFNIFARLQIAGNYIWITCVHEKETWGLIIKSKHLSLTLKSIFLQNWAYSIPIDKKIIDSWGENPFVKSLDKSTHKKLRQARHK